MARLFPESKSFKICSGFGRGSEIHLATAVNDEHFVKLFVDVLRRLVEGDEGGRLVNVGEDPQRFRKVESCRAIQATRAVLSQH